MEQKMNKGKASSDMTGYASIDKPWLKYYDEGVTEVPIPRKSIYQAIEETNKNRLGNIAIDLRTSANNYEKGIEITYKEYFKRMRDIAKAYSTMGLKKDDILKFEVIRNHLYILIDF